MAVDISKDRWVKFSHGLPRLLAVMLLLAFLQPSEFGQYFSHIHECLLMMAIGAVGACTNVLHCSPLTNLTLVVLIAAPTIAHIMIQMAQGDRTILVFALKTALGDFLAGKIDSPLYSILFGICILGLFPAIFLTMLALNPEYQMTSIWIPYHRVFPALFLIQFTSELGDRKLERFVFFRHRYCFELLTLSLCLALSLGPYSPMSHLEFRAIATDLVSCVFYRATNALIILAVRLSEGETSTVRIAVAIGFKLYSFLCRENFMLIKSPEVAKEVMSQSKSKGRIGLESNIVAPAWQPALSLESLDGNQWKSMRAEFDSLVKIIFPSPFKASDRMRSITASNARALAEEGQVVFVAQKVALVTASSLLELVFGDKWEAEDQVFIDSSWEWRKEIACRGIGDVEIKQRAVDRLILRLRRTPLLWEIYGEGWLEPDRFSLILQPFLISPIINVGDVMCAMSTSSLSLDMALNKMHPFPLWERFVSEDIIDDKGSIMVAKGTHTIIFPSDVCPIVSIFGAGERKCAGIFIAKPLMEEMASALSSCHDRFQPHQGHKYSGRHNDSNMTIWELSYMVRKVLVTVLGMWWRSSRDS